MSYIRISWSSWTWLHMPVIPALLRLRQEDYYKFEASLDCIVSSRPSCTKKSKTFSLKDQNNNNNFLEDLSKYTILSPLPPEFLILLVKEGKQTTTFLNMFQATLMLISRECRPLQTKGTNQKSCFDQVIH